MANMPPGARLHLAHAGEIVLEWVASPGSISPDPDGLVDLSGLRARPVHHAPAETDRPAVGAESLRLRSARRSRRAGVREGGKLNRLGVSESPDSPEWSTQRHSRDSSAGPSPGWGSRRYAARCPSMAARSH